MVEDAVVQTTETVTPVVKSTTAVQETPATETTVQTDIEKLEAQISQLKADGSAIYDTAIQALEDERAQLIAEAEAEAKKVEEEAQTVVADVENAEKTFREKYGNEVLNGAEIVALGVIIWRLFFF